MRNLKSGNQKENGKIWRVVINYQQFLENKKFNQKPSGFSPEGELNENLFPFQHDIELWALQKGKAALFCDCGMGKTLMQLEWANQVHKKTGGNILILAPLAVSKQTRGEGEKFRISVNIAANADQVKAGINVTNYEKLHLFDPGDFVGIVLDESSILKSFDSKTRTTLIDSFQNTPYRLACTATPAPNDFMELGNHSEFLGVMTRTEMLSMFFVHDGGETQKWRLKGHAEDKFWEWISSWAIVMRKPSDLGYDDSGFDLPPLEVKQIVAPSQAMEGYLIPLEAQTLQERRLARKASINERVKICADLVNKSKGPFLVWCDLNAESKMLAKMIPGAVEVTGSDKDEHKEKSMLDFCAGRFRVLISKPSICGFGMNFQHCAQMAFVGLSDSYEQFYQATRRCWRFGQKNPVTASVIISEAEGSVADNISRKEADAKKMADKMVSHTRRILKNEIHQTEMKDMEYSADEYMRLPSWVLAIDKKHMVV